MPDVDPLRPKPLTGISDSSREIERLKRENEKLRFRAELAESHAVTAGGESTSPGWKVFRALSSIRWKLAPRGTRLDRAVRSVLHRLAARIDARQDAREPASQSTQRARKSVLFISQAPEVSRRYRCAFQAEQLELLGATCDVVLDGSVDLREVVHYYGCFVLHRVPFRPDIAAFVDTAHNLGKSVLFDTDDLVFDPEAARHVAAYATMAPAERTQFVNGLLRYRETLRHCDGVIVSTEPLRETARQVHHRVEVIPNALGSDRFEKGAAGASARRAAPSDGPVVMGYLSGTATHDRDFDQAANAVCKALDSDPGLALEIVGPLRLDDRFDRFGDRIQRRPLVPWQELPAVIAGIDINLAPLEPDNPFAACKSSIKYIEAGALGVPTVASPTPDFVRAVQNNVNGVLAANDDEWSAALLELVADPRLRSRLGAAARADVLEHHTTRARAAGLYETLRRLVDRPGPPDPLTINFVMLAPIAQNSGGYRNIFRIARYLGSRGHVVRACIDPVAHLAGMNEDQIHAFVEAAFGPLNAEIVVGHDRIPAADVSIATFWRTAPVVARHRESLFKAYYIQDFEPEFYEDDAPEYAQAAATYGLPLRHVCLGTHLADRVGEYSGVPSDSIDFALDAEFRLLRGPGERGDRIRVLFFARPSLRRRGYDLGVEALRRVKEQHPECEIVFFGSRSEDLGEIPFEVTNLGVLTAQQVAEAMNDSHILLTFSLTNISNVPYEGMACGCAVVDLDLPNVSTMVDGGRNCLLAPLEADAIAATVSRLVTDSGLRETLGRQGSSDMLERTWDRTAAQFEERLLGLCFARVAGRRRLEAQRPASGPKAPGLTSTELSGLRKAFREDDFYLSFVSPAARAVLESIIDHPAFPGVTDPPALMQLGLLLRTAKPLRVLQLGTLVGFSAVYLADILRTNGVGHLVTVDPDVDASELAVRWVQEAGLDHHVSFVEGFSTDPEVGETVARSGPFDLVYLDSSHLYEPTLRELDLIFEEGGWLARDGLLVIHDAATQGVQDAAVRRALDEWYAQHATEFQLFVLEPPFWPVTTGLAVMRRSPPSLAGQPELERALGSAEG